ncbi:hypothetical protein ABH911_004272 [Pseudomonas protegens]|jgi:hypothetical protein|uniref:hypothetical protein n=1 Tax=Pseudomonas TaxID=286 RepID=UPI00069F202A|nr:MULTISPECIES: hypothetical protein [Pseudomonas]MBB1612015.1 hypothetical protein [Pseudomonas sp. UMC65]MBB1620026.1 hypothetical protein [Pseudomonas sp. UME65]MBF0643870.1 hypothetical protein [Pseudomonas protegens]NMZ31927.1 hypothetical protein [Pseudomonas protegens]NMZ87457.1 hypothetical protein [Pseudomonas protegens]
MRITLNTLHVEADHSLWVNFSSAFGEGRGQWLGTPPQTGQVHEVELSLEDDFVWDHNLWAATQDRPRISREQAGLRVTGQLLPREDEAVAALAIGPNIVLLSLQGGHAQPGGFVSLLARQVSLSPVAL